MLIKPGVRQVSLQEAEAKKEAELAKQMEAALEGDEDEEQRLIEERRRRRQQILAKHHQDKELSGEPVILHRSSCADCQTSHVGSACQWPVSHACGISSELSQLQVQRAGDVAAQLPAQHEHAMR